MEQASASSRLLTRSTTLPSVSCRSCERATISATSASSVTRSEIASPASVASGRPYRADRSRNGITPARRSVDLRRTAPCRRVGGLEAGRHVRRRIAAELARHHASRREHVVLVLEPQTEREQDLALRVHPAVHALLDAVDRAQRDLRLASQLCLRHQPVLAQLADPVHADRLRTIALHAHPPPSVGGQPTGLDSTESVSSVPGFSLGKMRSWPGVGGGSPQSNPQAGARDPTARRTWEISL